MVEKSQTDMGKELEERYMLVLKKPNESKSWDDVKADLISAKVSKFRRNELLIGKSKRPV